MDARMHLDVTSYAHCVSCTHVIQNSNAALQDPTHTFQTARQRCVSNRRGSRSLWGTKLVSVSNVEQCFSLSNAAICPCGLRGPPSWPWQQCNRLLSLGRPWGAVTLSRWCDGDIGGCSARRALKPNRLLRLGRPWGAATLSRWCEWWYRGM